MKEPGCPERRRKVAHPKAEMDALMFWALTWGLWIPLDSGLFAVGLDLGPATAPKSTYIPYSSSHRHPASRLPWARTQFTSAGLSRCHPCHLQRRVWRRSSEPQSDTEWLGAHCHLPARCLHSAAPRRRGAPRPNSSSREMPEIHGQALKFSI